MIRATRFSSIFTASLTFSVEVLCFGRIPSRIGISPQRNAISTIISRDSGVFGTKDYRMSFFKENKKISPWHDIPLKDSSGLYNFITEIPKFGKHKMEVMGKEPLNPIAQDMKNGNLRFYHGPIFWNYGCIPQTWEDPNVKDIHTNTCGDNDPIDVVEIGSMPLPLGSISKVKVLGALAMIDSGELDWKVIAINADDPLSANFNSKEDVEKYLPGVISGIREWFRWYKTPDGKPLNTYGYNEECLDASHAVEVIEETHAAWRNLIEGKVRDTGGLWTK